MHALIIEPHVFTSFMIEDALRDAGYDSIAVATSEAEAVAAAEASPPDIITAAVQLKPGSGVRAVEQIRTKHDAPVLFITHDVAEIGPREPGVEMVRKPFVMTNLQHAIAKLRQGRWWMLAPR